MQMTLPRNCICKLSTTMIEYASPCVIPLMCVFLRSVYYFIDDVDHEEHADIGEGDRPQLEIGEEQVETQFQGLATLGLLVLN